MPRASLQLAPQRLNFPVLFLQAPLRLPAPGFPGGNGLPQALDFRRPGGFPRRRRLGGNGCCARLCRHRPPRAQGQGQTGQEQRQPPARHR